MIPSPTTPPAVAPGEELGLGAPVVLVVEDEPDIRWLLRHQLAKAGYDVVEAADGERASELCRLAEFDAVLLDVTLPRRDGFGVLADLRNDPRTCHTPVVMVIGQTSAESATQGLLLSATDYLRKPFAANELLARVGSVLRTKALQDELRQRSEDMERVARLDALTGLHNRRHLDEQLAALAATARRRGELLAVLVVDADRFKAVNDAHGHAAGDAALVTVARRLSESLRAGDVCGRWGGEEFVVLLPSTDLAGAVAVGERIRVAVAGAPVDAGRAGSLALTVSVGVAAGMPTAADPGELVRRADAAVYAAKAKGRNRVEPAAPAAG